MQPDPLALILSDLLYQPPILKPSALAPHHAPLINHIAGLKLYMDPYIFSPSSSPAPPCDYQISHIEGLEACTELEELCLEDNRLASIEGLTGLDRCEE